MDKYRKAENDDDMNEDEKDDRHIATLDIFYEPNDGTPSDRRRRRRVLSCLVVHWQNRRR